MSSNQTEYYQLCLWDEDDPFLREEFNECNQKIDGAIPKIAVGSYTGDGSATRTFEVGFTPRAVLVTNSTGLAQMTYGNADYYYGGLAVTDQPVAAPYAQLVTIVEGGFQAAHAASQTQGVRTVSCSSNTNGTAYRYLAIG